MGIHKLSVLLVLCFGLTGCSSLMNRMPTPAIQEKDMIYEVQKGTTLDLWYGGEKKSVTLNESRFLVTEDFLIGMASDKTTKILNKVKGKQDTNKIIVVLGSILAIVGAVLGIVLTGKIKNLIPKKIIATVESK